MVATATSLLFPVSARVHASVCCGKETTYTYGLVHVKCFLDEILYIYIGCVDRWDLATRWTEIDGEFCAAFVGTA